MAELEKPSRREALSAAFEQAESTAEAIPEKTPAPVEVQKEPVKAGPESGPRGTSERARDEAGKFAKAEAVKSGEKATPKAEAVAVSEAKAARKYPSAWKKDYEPVFRKLESNSEFQPILDEIERREGEYHRGLEPYKQSAQFAQSVRKTLEPYLPTFQQLNLQPEQAISALLSADHQLRNAPPEVRPALFMRLMQGYGIDPASLQNAHQVNPELYQLQNELQQVKQQTNTFLSSLQKSYETEAASDVEKFKDGKPFFDDVREEMGKLINAGLASDLQEAYDKAIYANPAIRGKVLAEQQAKADAERRQKEQHKVEQARSAGVQVKGAPTGSSNSAALKAKDRRAMLEEAWDRHS